MLNSLFNVFIIYHVVEMVAGTDDLQITPCIPKWYEGISMELTCKLFSGIVVTTASVKKNGTTVVQCNATFGDCITVNDDIYGIVNTTSSSVTMKIVSFNRGLHVALWTCADTSGPAATNCNITESPKYSINYTNFADIPDEKVSSFTLMICGTCTYGEPNITFKFVDVATMKPTYIIASNKATADGCNTDEEKTCSTATIEATSSDITYNVSYTIEHPSLSIDISGYIPKLLNIRDLNECELNTHDCHSNADCHNTDGSYTCECKTGYTGDGKSCDEEDTQTSLIIGLCVGGVICIILGLGVYYFVHNRK